ncbi:MAG: gluconokinase [Opitutales bacterium]
MKESIIILMGVSGCGKSVIGQALAERLGIPFLEGDAFHPPENLAKMGSGMPLEDADRIDWMVAIRAAMMQERQSAIVACSALKRKHREFLSDISKKVQFIHLRGDHDLLKRRIESRTGHFFDPKLLDSQLTSLEEPSPEEGAIVIEVDRTVENIVATIHARLETSEQSKRKSS